MNFLTANRILESIRDDLEFGFLEEARTKLAEALRLREDETPGHFLIKSLGAKPTNKSKKDAAKPEDPKKKPTHFAFKSLLKQWKESKEAGNSETLMEFVLRARGR